MCRRLCDFVGEVGCSGTQLGIGNHPVDQPARLGFTCGYRATSAVIGPGYELGIQMIQVCMERRATSAGLDSASEVSHSPLRD
jgi:hypothetical protein